MSWANLQLAIGSTCRTDKWRPGKGWFASWWREGRENVWGPALPCLGLQGKKVVLWRWAHKCRLMYNAGLGVCLSSFLPCLLHHLPLTKLAGILPGGWIKKENSPKRVFLSIHPALPLYLPFLWHTLQCFFVPQTLGFLLHKTLRCKVTEYQGWVVRVVMGAKLQSSIVLFGGHTERYNKTFTVFRWRLLATCSFKRNLSGAWCFLLCATQSHVCKAKIAL